MKKIFLVIALMGLSELYAQEFAVMTVYSDSRVRDDKKGTFKPQFKGYLEHSSEQPPVVGKIEKFGAKYQMNIASFIKEMDTKGYKLISTDTGGNGTNNSVTRLYFRKD